MKLRLVNHVPVKRRYHAMSGFMNFDNANLAMLAFNALHLLGRSALKMKDTLSRKFKVQRRRLRSVIQDLIYIDAREHGILDQYF